MINQVQKSQHLRKKRAVRVRKNIHGTSLKPRLCVVKSNKHIHAQLIDDHEGRTLGAVATFSKELRSTEHNGKSKESAQKLGEMMGQIANRLGVKEVVFDRGPFRYHGILAAFADAVRAAGVKF